MRLSPLLQGGFFVPDHTRHRANEPSQLTNRLRKTAPNPFPSPWKTEANNTPQNQTPFPQPVDSVKNRVFSAIRIHDSSGLCKTNNNSCSGFLRFSTLSPVTTTAVWIVFLKIKKHPVDGWRRSQTPGPLRFVQACETVETLKRSSEQPRHETGLFPVGTQRSAPIG